MSHYSEVKTTFKDEKALVAALVDQGFALSDIIVSATPVPLGGSGGRGHIVIRKSVIEKLKGYAYTDLAYEKVDGVYKAHIDKYTFGSAWTNSIQQRYDYRLQTERARLMGYQLTETKQKDGSIKVIARR